MIAELQPLTSAPPLQELADFRYTLRRFLQFSEEAASAAGLTTQQHQLLLQVAGAAGGIRVTVGYIAERLALRHHTVVELSKRCEEGGLVVRTSEQGEYRHVILTLTAQGVRLLHTLSEAHLQELYVLGPALIKTLAPLTKNQAGTVRA
jgi:DNA-binding MarR family transcriptional regulator